MKRPTPNRRRATVLIMVVSLLALLFVIVTGFLTQSRYNQQVLQTSRIADLPNDVLDATNQLAISLIREQLIDANGGVLIASGGGSLDVDIPGYRKSYFLGANEPAWDYSGVAPRTPVNVSSVAGSNVLTGVIWPALTRLEGSDATKPEYRALYELIPEDERDSDDVFRQVDLETAGFTAPMDADGDGFPDADPLFSGLAIESANNLAGLPVYLPDPVDPSVFSPASMPDPALFPSAPVAMWRRYRESGRFEVPVRIISHGGMYAFDAAAASTPLGLEAPPQRGFLMDLFDRLRRPGDPSLSQKYATQGAQDYLFGQVAASRSGVEAALRRRFALPSLAYADPLDQNGVLRRVPPVLALLESGWGRSDFTGFRNTLLPTFQAESMFELSPSSWQRINIAGELRGGLNNPRTNWANTLAYDTVRFNTNSVGTQKANYTHRHHTTTTNNSDELARKQQRGEPDFSDETKRLRTYRGELKFYLGEVAKAFDQVGAGQYAFNPARGRIVIDQLARYYYDMLDSHQQWEGAASAGLFDQDPGTGNDQVLTRRQQALSLAVNTVAFAMPRDTGGAQTGWVDTVWYVDSASPDPVTNAVPMYVGHAPQPYFSEVIAYDNTIPDDESTDPADEFVQGRLSIAVELFNPNDPHYNGGADVFALNLSQFAISVGSAQPFDNNPFVWRQFIDMGDGQFLDQQFEGRSFHTIVLRDNNPALPLNDHFVMPGLTPTVDLSLAGAGDWITLNLWRKARRFVDASGAGFVDSSVTPTEGWVLVDRIQVRRPRPPAEFNPGPPIVYPPDTENWASRYRDLAPSAHYASLALAGHSDDYNYARWGVAVADDDSYEWSDRQSTNPGDDPRNEHLGYGGPSTLSVAPNIDPSLEQRRTYLTDLGPQDPLAGGRRVPEAPLITMNAGPVGPGTLYQRLNNLAMFGNPSDLRPRSFPTPGFLLFVPRYANAQKMDTADARRVENGLGTTTLAARTVSLTLDKERARFTLGAATAPADFGHMPLFNNSQDVEANSLLGRVGKLPWGALVFEYFTTLDPTAPGIDPLRVPGRINVNTASWYTLANLPLIGPNPATEEIAEIRANPGGVGVGADPSPAFWDWRVGVLTGSSNPGDIVDPYTGNNVFRQLSRDPSAQVESGAYASPGRPPLLPRRTSQNNARHRLGALLAQSLVSARDGVQYVPAAGPGTTPYWDAFARGGNVDNTILPNVPLGRYRAATYGTVRGAASGGRGPTEYGFVSLGELLNVKGVDGSPPALLNDVVNNTLGRGDFVRAVSLVALLDTQWLTTRSNTFTVYASVTDRDEPQASLRSQVTVDRTPMLPRLSYYDPQDGVTPRVPTGPAAQFYLGLGGSNAVLQRAENASASFEVIAERRTGLLNARFDE